MITTIHQPDFLPWYGLFQKIAKADTWIVLDHTDNNPRDAAFWGRRVKILNNGEAQWFSVTLNKSPTGVVGMPINQMTINTSNPKVADKALRTLQMAYAKAPYFKNYFSLVEQYFHHESEFLMVRNMDFMTAVMKLLKIDTRIVFSSELETTASSTELLVEILQQVSAETYLCGNGAAGYQENDLFEQAGIQLQYNEVEQFNYPQLRTSEFVPGLSILDSLFHLGEDAVAEHIRA